MEDSQLLKGILEGCVLSIISQKETYGYEILSELTNKGFTEILEGTLYPVLTRLENKKSIQCRKEKSPLGPVRKYYTITEEGKVRLQNFILSYKNVTASAEKILLGGKNNER